MYLVRLLCLASSYKLGGRCLAGLDLHDKNDWVRPVSAASDGTLSLSHCASKEGRWPEVGEVWRLSVLEHVPKPWQPENWRIADSPWEHEPDLEADDFLELIAGHLWKQAGLFGTEGDRIAADLCRAQPREMSLAVIEPEGVQWQVTTNIRGRRQIRAVFQHAGAAYDLGITDLAWKRRLADLDLGLHPRSAAGIDDAEPIWFTVSLSEPAEFDDNCYKLVAAVIEG